MKKFESYIPFASSILYTYSVFSGEITEVFIAKLEKLCKRANNSVIEFGRPDQLDSMVQQASYQYLTLLPYYFDDEDESALKLMEELDFRSKTNMVECYFAMYAIYYYLEYTYDIQKSIEILQHLIEERLPDVELPQNIEKSLKEYKFSLIILLCEELQRQRQSELDGHGYED